VRACECRGERGGGGELLLVKEEEEEVDEKLVLMVRVSAGRFAFPSR